MAANGAAANGAAEKPGFFAPDIQTLLRQRAARLEGLPDAILDSDNLDSDGSEQWDGETKDAPEEVEPKKPDARPLSVTDLLAAGFLRVEAEPLDVAAARRSFAAKEDCQQVTLEGRPEPAPMRLRRLQREVATLCQWAEDAPEASAGALQLCKEARLAGEKLKESKELQAEQRVWLPPESDQTRQDLAAASQLLRLNREEATGKGPNYNLAAPSAGWLLSNQAEAVAGLQERLQTVREALGENEALEGPLAAESRRLHQRLERLETLGGDSCERLVASLALLCADIDVAVSSAKHLEAMEAEQEREEQELSKPVSPTSKALAQEVDAGVETVSMQVERLYEEVASLDTLALRAKDLEQQLCGQDALRKQLELFASDLAMAEARSTKAVEMLKATSSVATSMREASKASSERLQKDLRSLEEKLGKLPQR